VRTQRKLGFPAIAAMLGLAFAIPAVADTSDSLGPTLDCFGEGSSRRIEGCTELLASPGLSTTDRSMAHAMRALGLSLAGRYDEALPDYDQAIELDPTSAIALNNRAWTLFKSGRSEKGMPDVERSLMLAPGNAHAHDTRAHIHQALGRARDALADYHRAMQLGGERIIKLYQCGLAAEGLYKGEMTGLYTSDLRRALEVCVYRTGCDPLPPDEDCRYASS
jgi:tetratricopeptide (TPR) repeat protein